MPSLRDFDTEALPHIDAAYNLAFWLLRNEADAEDVVQDAYLRAFKAYGQFHGGDIRPWLLTIVRNVAYRWLSVRKRNANNVVSIEDALAGRGDHDGPAFEPASVAPSAEDLLISSGECALVRRALAELAPSYREVIVLREFEGLSYQDIAGVTGVPAGTVMSRLSRARAQLKDLLTGLMTKENHNAL
ncbi:MAG: sigma-70 family RNA polymerase sigma factor [Xanthobacteraceae bacterium]|nr:sigma-70 family RNA polymerase sigma factor [Xanthobacteraceae bacterium]